ncbi:4Fe-4S single cluster domain-containing protein [Roseimicrobium sp. ORNL1]|uniref:4Fe-4S single cluster domain-containing protein n=1 Tax=Roseimicrobium sp. ORNL1 TaxID=2711231 RepID=UPI0013E1662C|nr:4Fe-4S single cluster domain-containing protein [Roseimicrobium sp. ORNL1]QIF02433.1 radical SAM protein [Roseimicrobium sp. ORNL1]
MRIFLSRLHFPVTTLGHGSRVGIWFQGCSLRCPGCISVDTWAHGQGETTLEEVLRTISPWLQAADGVTISGGEPFEQAEALGALLQSLRQEIGAGKDILLYSGQPWEKIAPLVSGWTGLVDVVIGDPFIRSATQTLVWRGSDNQRLHMLSPLGQERYAKWQQAVRETLPKTFDVCFEGDTLWMAGIPEPGSLKQIQRALAEAGFASTISDTDSREGSSIPVFA